MSSAKASRGLVRVLIAVNVGLAAASIVAGIVQLVQGESVGWLLILFAPIIVLLGNVRVSQLRDRRQVRETRELRDSQQLPNPKEQRTPSE